ncbi:hypothetical protein MSAN_00843700 [Mycena sanguinolenta]|uniref:Uncharacterized protein n=1 Tax=Mycena sanguinolenta TaxID=230812 RepID=A0A8H7DAZ2_9AGAR|nr:hypothetical protein MSAN_00843700 [Mycena sanguinolenta]
MSNFSSVQAAPVAVNVTVFNISSILGVVSLTLIVATAYFSSTVRRSDLWYRHIIAWIVYNTAFLVLIGHQGDPDPPFGLCFFQAALIYAVPTFPTLSAFCFVADLYIRLSAVLFNKRKIRPALKTFLGLFPLIVLGCVFIVAMGLVVDPQTVGFEENHLYCHDSTSIQATITGAIIIMTGFLIFPLEIWIAVVLYRNWRSFRGSRSPDQHLFLTMFIRMVLFTIISMLGVGLSSYSFGSSTAFNPYWTRLVLTIVPIIAAITFGSQEDIMRSWIFWREPPLNVSKPEKEADVSV